MIWFAGVAVAAVLLAASVEHMTALAATTPTVPLTGLLEAGGEEVIVKHQQMLKPMLIGAGVLVALVIAGVPVGGAAPLLILLVCPLMMIFMVRGMDHGGSQSHDEHSHTDRERADSR